MNWAAVSYPGTREVNEDSVGIAEAADMRCFIVADGLGGHGKGDIASGLAVAAFQKVFKESTEPIQERMRLAFEQAQKDILSEQVKTHSQTQMKTTVTALAVSEREILWGHIGDTRLYAFSHHWIRTRTLDHSVPQMLVMAKEIKENEIRNHPDRNKLLRVIGVSGDTPRYEIAPTWKRRKHQAFLLCTDGFWELILEKEMQKCLKNAENVQQWLEQMEQIVRQRGGDSEMDNFSAIGVWL